MTTLLQAEDAFMADLDLLDDRLLQYEYLLSHIAQLDELPAERCTPERKVAGCVSNAWMELTAPDGCLHVRLTADSLIIKGLLGVVTTLVQGRTLAEVAAWEPRFLEHPQLKPQLNVDRRQGLASIVREVVAWCAAHATALGAE